MPSKRIRTQAPNVGGGGGSVTVLDAFTDAFTLAITFTDPGNATPTDAVSIALQLDDSNDVQADTLGLGIQVDDNTAVPTDALTQLAIAIADDTGVAVQTDVDTYAIAFNAGNDSNADLVETVQLAFPAPDFADTTTAPSEGNSFTMRVWLSASAGAKVAPANADGQNDGLVAQVYTAVGDPATRDMTSTLGANLPTATVTSVIYRGWFESRNNLITSTGSLIMHSTSGLFTDVVMFSNSALASTVTHLSGDFTFDLIAAGINTLAKLQSCQMIHRVVDAVAGVNSTHLDVDAGCLEVTGAFS